MMADEPTIEPEWIDGIPYCSTACGSWEKRGRSGYCLLGEEPCDVCHHAVRQMAKRIAELEAAARGLLELCKSSLNPDTLERTATYCQSELPNTANWLREIAAHIRPAVRRLEAAMEGGTT